MKATKACSSSAVSCRFPSSWRFTVSGTSGSGQHPLGHGLAFGRESVRAARLDVSRVVEIHDGLQAGEIAVVHVGLHEGGVGSFVHVAQRWNLHPPHIVLGVFAPLRLRLEKTAEAEVDKVAAKRIGGLLIPRIGR